MRLALLPTAEWTSMLAIDGSMTMVCYKSVWSCLKQVARRFAQMVAVVDLILRSKLWEEDSHF
jgi:hypothetical protein